MKIKADKSISMESEEENMLFGTREAGGTKMVLSVGNEQNELLEQVSIPTEAPEKTIPAMMDWFSGKGIVSL